MKRVISLYEHQFLSYQEIHLTAQEAVLDAIEGLNAAAGCEILRVERKGLRAMDRVGLVRAGNVSIEILPKIDAARRDPGEQASPSRAAARNLLAMLSYAYSFPIQAEAAAELQTEPGGWFELLTRMFAAELHQQFAMGVAHQYVAREDNLEVLRGRWDVGRQARRPLHERNRFEVSYEELTPDTPLNQVFLHVVNALRLLSSEPSNLSLLASLRDWLQPVTTLPEIPAGLLERVAFNRVNERFRPAFSLARLFLEGNVVQLRSGDVPAYAFVFDMGHLFERFIAGFLTRFRGRILPPAWQDTEVLVQSTGPRVFLAACEGRGVLRLIPDLMLRRKASTLPLLVADTKYKLLEVSTRTDKGRGEMGREDAYQMLSYLVRLECRQGLLIYPQAESGEKVRRRWEIQIPGLDLYACTVDLRVPLDQPNILIQEMAEIFAWIAGKTLAPSI